MIIIIKNSAIIQANVIGKYKKIKKRNELHHDVNNLSFIFCRNH